jgi:hypothetical protein
MVNKPVSQIFYSLDNFGNVTANSNASLTFPNLSNGRHNITVYAQDEYGIISSPSTVYFSVKTNSSTPILIAVASTAAAVVCIGVGLLGYRKRHKGNTVAE